MTTHTQDTRGKSITESIKECYTKTKDVNEIRELLLKKGIDKNNHFIRNVVYRLKTNNKLLKSNIEPKEQTEEIKQEEEPFLKIELKEEEDGSITLFVKTIKTFEEWLVKNKELRETESLLGEDKKGNFYYMRLNINSREFDDINSYVYYRNCINLAILRCKGISEGLKFNIRTLINEKQLRESTKAFIKRFSNIYRTLVLNEKIEISGEVKPIVKDNTTSTLNVYNQMGERQNV